MFVKRLSTHILLSCFEGSANKVEVLFVQADKTEVQTVLDAGKMVQDEKFKYKCEVCGRRYMQEYSYQRHVQCHSGNSLIVSLDPNTLYMHRNASRWKVPSYIKYDFPQIYSLILIHFII